MYIVKRSTEHPCITTEPKLEQGTTAIQGYGAARQFELGQTAQTEDKTCQILFLPTCGKRMPKPFLDMNKNSSLGYAVPPSSRYGLNVEAADYKSAVGRSF